jgi:hypothetical protein
LLRLLARPSFAEGNFWSAIKVLLKLRRGINKSQVIPAQAGIQVSDSA